MFLVNQDLCKSDFRLTFDKLRAGKLRMCGSMYFSSFVGYFSALQGGEITYKGKIRGLCKS
jgi:hypothetical protein